MNKREQDLCRFYAENGGNLWDAGKAAGYSDKYVEHRGWEILKRPEIQEEINRIRQRMNQLADKNTTDVINQIARHAFAEILDYVREDPESPGNWIGKKPDELTPAQRSAVAAFKTVPVYEKDESGEIKKPRVIKRYEYKYELHSQPMALIQMGRHFGMFDDRLKITNGAGNRFANLTPEQLVELRTQIVKYMRDSTGELPAIDGEFSESAKMLSDGRGSGGAERDTVGGGVRVGGRRTAAN